MKLFSQETITKCFYCLTLGALAIYLLLKLLDINSSTVYTNLALSRNEGGKQGRNGVNWNINTRSKSHINGSFQHGKVKKLKTDERMNTSSLHYDGHDFMKDPKITFDKRFKNPCWYEGDTLKCLPYFFLVGVKKGGTTTTFKRILNLTAVVKPDFRKEAQFFGRKRFRKGTAHDTNGIIIQRDTGQQLELSTSMCRDRKRTIEAPAEPAMHYKGQKQRGTNHFQGDKYSDDIRAYAGMLKNTAKFIQNKSESEYFKVNKTNPYITGDGSPSNLHINSHWMNLPGNENLTEPKYVTLDYIKHFLPDAKIIVIFRDPIRRLYSDYYQVVKGKRIPGKFVAGPKHFHGMVVDGLRMYRDCFSIRTVRSCVYDPTYYSKTKQMQMQLGIYYIFWKELLRVFPTDQILVLQNQDLSSAETYLKIQTFLGLDPLPVSDIKRITNSQWYNSKASGKPPMLNETLRLLYEFYKPFNEKMAALMKDDTFLYKYDVV